MSKVDVLLGLQWGDEGKGKIVDFLAPNYDIVARFQGGPNAGHTLEFEGNKHVLHQIPSGIFRPEIKNVVGNGVVLDPITFNRELKELDPFHIDFSKQLIISNKAQLIVPTHRLLDSAYELSKGKSKIGSTLRGIGPTYEDKVARVGLRVGDILQNDFKARYEALKEKHLSILNHYQFDCSALEEEEDKFWHAVEVLRKQNISNTEYLLNEALQRGEKVLAEGAQGSLLDIDFGSYPFVTSSNTVSAGACIGLGISPRHIGEIFGIFKAYCTRVGSGPFPTELLDEQGEALRKSGHEFGATTGRPRRCGWLDLPALKYTAMLNGVTQMFMMKVDVLSGQEHLKLCTAYSNQETQEISQEMPLYFDDKIEPVVKDCDVWGEEIGHSFEAFPEELKNYINQIEGHVGAPISLVSMGPDRSQTTARADWELSPTH